MEYVVEDVALLRKKISTPELGSFVNLAYSQKGFGVVSAWKDGPVLAFNPVNDVYSDFLSMVKFSVIPPSEMDSYFRKILAAHPSGERRKLGSSLLDVKSAVSMSSFYNIPDKYVSDTEGLRELLSSGESGSSYLDEVFELLPAETRNSYRLNQECIGNLLSIFRFAKDLFLTYSALSVGNGDSFPEKTYANDILEKLALPPESGAESDAMSLLEQIVLSKMELPSDLRENIAELAKDMDEMERAVLAREVFLLGDRVAAQSEENYPLMDALFKLAVEIYAPVEQKLRRYFLVSG